MKTANIGNIAAEMPNSKKEKFNLSHDNNTTYDWGSVQPTLCKMMMPDSTINIENEQLIRMAPMVVPTFGRVKIKNIAHFVPIEEIFPNWDALLAQTKVTRTSIYNGQPSASTYTPQYVPYINNNILAAWCLAGCKINLYFSGVVGTINENTWYCARNTGTWSTPAGWPSATTATREYLDKIVRIPNTNTTVKQNITQLKYNGYRIILQNIILKKDGSKLLNNDGAWVVYMPTITTMTNEPLANANGKGYTHSASNEQNAYDSNLGDEHITFDEADLIWEYDGSAHAGITSADRAANSGEPVEGITSNEFDSCKIRIVFKLSSFGKRLRKTLIGLGYDVNLANDDEVSILPLIAYYKAWWDSYAPERTKNFYETNAWKIIQSAMAGARGADLTYTFNQANATDARGYFIGFMGDLGQCFATEKIDVISAATDAYYNEAANLDTATSSTLMQAAINEAINTLLVQPKTGATTNADGSSNGWGYATGYDNAATQPGGMVTLDEGATYTRLTQPQLTALKKAYIMLNKSSVAGKAVAEILRANGQGDYVEECNGKFIDVNEETIKISDVIATAATDKASLGQYGGRGLGLGYAKVSHSTSRWGYFIILSAIIPESGYINGPAHENEAISWDKIYQAELDGLAYEAIQKKTLMGCPLINDKTYKDTFGFVPTYTQWKFMNNKANGDFSLNSRKKYMTPFTLDKYIPIGDANVYSVEETNGHAGSTTELCSPTFHYEDTPNAGEDYRYINKFPWNGSYNRIFEASDDGLEWSVFSPNNNAFLFNAFEYDNFMVHNVFAITYWAHMKSIENSYGTYDEEHGAPDTTIKRS